jgi:FAD/FMN-containing dehydrogenase
MGGGHALSPYLSSTEGVHISTSAFKSIEYDERTETVTFGAGLKWDELYVALEKHGVNVPGGRIPGVGVGGFILGGGGRTSSIFVRPKGLLTLRLDRLLTTYEPGRVDY